MAVWNTWRARLASLTNPSTRLAQWAQALPSAVKGPQGPLTADSIAARDIADWGEWGSPNGSSPGEVKGWAMENGQRYRSASVTIPALAAWIQIEKRSWNGDIQAIQAMTSSKSRLEDYPSMEAFAQARCPDWIQSPSADKMAKLLDWHEIRPREGLVMAEWDGRLVLNNNGGSHHFAAAREQARLLGQTVLMETHLTVKRLNPQAVQALTQAYDIVAIPKEAQQANAFFDAMEKLGASFYTLPMPFPHHQLQAILLPKTDANSRLAASTLRQHGLWDVGATCQALAAGQYRHARAHDGYSPEPAPSPIPALTSTSTRTRPSLS